MKLVTTTWLSPLLSKKLHGNTLRHTWHTLILLKSAYFKHFEHFSAIEKFKTTNFAANHCEYVWNWSQQHDFHYHWEKSCMGILWGTPEIQWFCLKQLKTAYFKHFEHFLAIEIFEKVTFAANHYEYSESGHNNMTFTSFEQKIAWVDVVAYLRYSNFA